MHKGAERLLPIVVHIPVLGAEYTGVARSYRFEASMRGARGEQDSVVPLTQRAFAIFDHSEVSGSPEMAGFWTSTPMHYSPAAARRKPTP